LAIGIDRETKDTSLTLQKGGGVTRQEAVQRLRIWAAHAQHEAIEADTVSNAQNWQGQAQVLSIVANFLAGQGPEVEDTTLWRRVVADRERTLAEWLIRQETAEADIYAGAVAGYDTALTALKDIAGRVWPRIEPHVG
jgi:hypothetical protein